MESCSRRSRRIARSLVAGGLLLCLTWPCVAAPEPRGAPPPGVEDERNDDEPSKPPLVWREWQLFDPFVSRRESLAGFSLDELREVSALVPQSGWSLRFGDATTTLRSRWWIALERHHLLRVARRSTYMLELSSYDYLAGVRAGPVELGGGVGLVPFGVDVSRGDWSLSLASPRASLRGTLKLGAVRLSLDAFRQYTWRVWGEESAWVQGVAFEVAVEQARITHRAGHPLIFTR